MKFEETHIKGCYVIQPDLYRDDRGIFMETYNKRTFEDAIGLQVDFVQDNQSISGRGILRGLHFQFGEHAQAKWVRVIKGEVLDVVVDLRKNSDTFGSHFKIKLSESNNKSLFIPKGMAHGFLSLREETIFAYKCDNYYNREAEGGLLFNDDFLNIDWEYPQQNVIISKKDRKLPKFTDLYS